ncbi:MAG: tRNA (N6-threonylcarbamoyladenosine(37)-N6)-methyltransferase TrmO [Archaeoglobaceae archaeon]
MLPDSQTSFDVKPIGIIKSPYKSPSEAPRQGRFSKEIVEIEIFPEFEDGLRDIETCSHLIVLYWLHLAERDKLIVVPPHDTREHGVFATRSPSRPNPIGFAVVELLDRNGRVLKVRGLDAIDGTPVVDIKPYSSEIDSIGNAKIGWFEEANPHSRLKGLLLRAKEFHGHICPFLALGVKMSVMAMDRLGIKPDSFASIGEDILAIVEANNCMSDGVQIATGCTLGNNSLIYLDLGKNAVTVVRRSDWKGVRVFVDAEKVRRHFSGEALELFDKVIVRREGSEEDAKKLSELWEEIGWKMLDIPEEEFRVEFVEVQPIERAPIFENARCERCGELAMATRVKDGLCLRCAGSYYAVVGRGIVKFEDGEMREVV